MKLSYRGIKYNKNTDSCDLNFTQRIIPAKFRGITYHISYQKNIKNLTHNGLKYRGITYQANVKYPDPKTINNNPLINRQILESELIS